MEQKNVFISYRSTPYNILRQCGCRVINDEEECNSNKAIRCSVVNCSFRRAAIFANSSKYNCYIVPPTFMLPPESLLRVSDFFEKSHKLYNWISCCDIFVRFEIDEDSIWTDLEMRFWKRHSLKKNENRYYEIQLGSHNETEWEEYTFRSIERSQAKFLDRLIYYTQSDHRHDHAWGAYSNCFICVCPNCGGITLYSPNAIKYLISNRYGVNCTFCHKGNFHLRYISKWRFLISYAYDGQTSQIFPLNYTTIINLILGSSKEILKDIHLICMSHESFNELIPMVQMIIGIKDYVKKLATGTDVELRVYDENRNKIDKIPMMKIKDVCYSFDVITSILDVCKRLS